MKIIIPGNRKNLMPKNLKAICCQLSKIRPNTFLMKAMNQIQTGVQKRNLRKVVKKMNMKLLKFYEQQKR